MIAGGGHEAVRKAAVDRRQMARRVRDRKVKVDRRAGRDRRAGGDRRIPDEFFKE